VASLSWDFRLQRLVHEVAALPRRRHRFVYLLTVLMLANFWAARSGSVTGADPNAGPLEKVDLKVVADIQARRPAGFPIGGIDISHHDHRFFAPHWGTEAAAGSQFVYIKATEGMTYVNPNFAGDYTAAKAAGRYVGAYVYARPDLGNPLGQAEFFLDHAKFTRDSRTLVPFVDLEWPYEGVKADDCYNLTPEQLRVWIAVFIGRIELEVGRKPMIYTNTHWWNPCTGNDTAYADHPLDIAGYTKAPPKLPAGWTTFALWQYAAGDPKVKHSHDRDVVNGDLEALKALAWPPPPAQR
jgi:GH25 family lysozyme M1 (1,4-beta-N-acetylmuramidase)